MRVPTVSAFTSRAPFSTFRCCETAGLVVVRAEGTRRLYAVDTRGIEAMRNWLDGFWDEALVAFKRAAEKEAAKERKH